VVVPASYVFLLRGQGAATEVLLQLRRGTGYMDGHWAAAAAGHVERGETAYDAARREAAEEIDVREVDLRFATSMQRTRNADPLDERIDFFFTARTWSGEPRVVEPAKCAELRWCRLDALPAPVVPHEESVLRGLRDGDLAPYTSFGFHRKGEGAP
jgi:8-oxo-dGTP pyrophosphatase MutT (NUDIX family)